MKVFLTGVSCVGKTTIGAELAAILGMPFSDLDQEIERFFKTSIAHLQSKFLTTYSYRQKASEALKHFLSQERAKDCVVALPPSGLMDNYWRVVKRVKGAVVVLADSPENILKRITFYDEDSRPIEKRLDEHERRLYLKEIKQDIAYYRRSYQRADITVDLSGLGPQESAAKVKEVLKPMLLDTNSIGEEDMPCPR